MMTRDIVRAEAIACGLSQKEADEIAELAFIAHINATPAQNRRFYELGKKLNWPVSYRRPV